MFRAIELTGIHHVTAIAGDPQKNLDFYTRVLGLRLVKKTVNFDDPYSYHLYFGDAKGSPSTLITFFPWGAGGHPGRRGTGQLAIYSFAVPAGSLGYWADRLKSMGIAVSGPVQRWDEEVLTLFDHDGFEIELIATTLVNHDAWDHRIPAEFAIRGLHGIALSTASHATAKFVSEVLQFRASGDLKNRMRFETGMGGSGAIIDLIHEPKSPKGLIGVGGIHHVAWRTPDDRRQVTARDIIMEAGHQVTPVIDRNYFHSIYFNEPGGVIFEIATDPPGFEIDEPRETLGTALKLPPQYEPYRPDLERRLPTLRMAPEEARVG